MFMTAIIRRPNAEELFYETLKQLSDGGKRLILVIAGNHDNPSALKRRDPLARDHGILMAGVPKTIIPTGGYGQHRVVASGAGYVELEINGEQAVILLLPYQRRTASMRLYMI